ncbi:protein kinase [Gordonia amicalis]|nr:protein kinase [Gordonia amicalis]
MRGTAEWTCGPSGATPTPGDEAVQRPVGLDSLSGCDDEPALGSRKLQQQDGDVAQGEDRWIEVSKSAFSHEAEGLKFLHDLVPNASPYRAWTNFEFMDNHGQWHEIDALILGRRRLHLVELKAYTGVLQGSETSWVITSLGGRSRTQRSPLLVTRRKAQRLASRIEEEARKVALSAGLDAEKVRRALPFVQESVFLHGDQFHADMPDLAKSSLFGMDGREDQTGLPGISTRLLEPPSDSRRVDEDLSVIIALALQNLGIARRTERDAGSWTITGKPLANGIDWQEWSAKHKATGTEGRARIVSLRPGTPAQARAAAHRRMQREFSLLSSLRHESIVAPRDLVQDDDGNTVLIFPDLPEYEQLDLALATRELTAEQQIQVLTEVSEALAYAHRNQVAHRGLSPSTVLINTHALDEGGTVRIRLADWSWAGRVHSPGTQSSTMLGTPDQPGTAVEDVYQAPEDRWASDADRLALDVFSLGALAYYLLSGGQAPASNRAELLERLRQEQGLDLAASGGRFVDENLRALVLRSTCPSVSKRVAADRKTGVPSFGAHQFAAELSDYRRDRLEPATQHVDPLNPAPGSLIADRFEVIRVLGVGSTARGVLVTDRNDDDAVRVLKVGLDDSAAARLHDEAQVLTELARHTPRVPGVVELIDGPLDLSGRKALLLTNCGEQTLSDLVRHTPLTESRLRTWGLELLDIVVALDSIGISHRDIKPANLGLARVDGRTKAARRTRLALFDFSLSRADVSQIEAGTPPYRDPFLGIGIRTTFDSAAERYSAAVVLYEMATSSTPVYGDGMSDPRVLNDDVTVTAEDFTAAGLSRSRAEALVAFFRTALTRNAKDRFDTAAAMRAAWASAFQVKAAGEHPSAPAPIDPIAKPAAPQPVARTYDSLDTLATEFAKAAGNKPSVMRRQVVELVLGTHERSPADPFITYPALAALAGVTSGRIAQIFGEFSDLWAKNDRLAATAADLYRRGLTLLEASGGASTPELLARELAGSLNTESVADPQRTALGVLRLLLSSRPGTEYQDRSSTDTAVQMVRRHGSGTVAMIATVAVPRRLPAVLASAAETLVDSALAQGTLLVMPDDAKNQLRSAAAAVLDLDGADVEIPGHALLRIAAVASTEVALSSRDELHAASLPVDGALRILLRGLSTADSFGRSELESRWSARFPALTQLLPRRPDLDGLIESVVPGMTWDDASARYRFADAPRTGTNIPTRTTLTTAHPVPTTGTSDVEYILAASARERTFRALGVPLGYSDVVAQALVEHFGATHIDVTELLLGELKQRASSAGLAWEAILAADAGAAADRDGLKGFVAQALPTLVSAVDHAGGPVVLTDLSTLAAYGQLSVLHKWLDLTAPPKYAVWALVPQPEEAGGPPGARVDGTALLPNSPEQFVQVNKDEIKALIAAVRSNDQVKEHI